jgi:para-nitrobenzyl esterase
VCAQVTTLGVYAGPQSDNEDCLYLNVFTPNLRPRQAMPVIVYIHGGGNFSGATADYDASKLARVGNVVVTIAYRLNLMGFLAHPALDREGHAFANYGLLDQQAALRWVRRNAPAFGGDPSNVTVGGQSNGGYNALLHMVSPLSSGLFQKAISQSGTRVIFDPIPTRKEAEANGVAFAIAAGCGSGVGSDVARCLRDLPAARVEALAGTAMDRSRFVINTAIVDGTIIPEQPLALFKSGRFSRVPLMFGATADERNVFTMVAAYWAAKTANGVIVATEQDYRDFVGSSFGPPSYAPGTSAKVADRYPLAAYTAPQAAMARLSSDATICIERRFNLLLSARIPLFAYEFSDRTAPSYFPPVAGVETGAYHSAELQYLFPFWHGGPDGVPMPLSGRQQALAEQITRSVANFARNADPSPSTAFEWPRFTSASDSRAWVMQDAQGFSTVTNRQYAKMHLCEFWDSVSAPS